MSRTSLSLQRRIGRALRARREVLGLSQENAAEKVGKHRVDYSRIETGKINIRLATLEKLCTALGARPWEILRAADEETSKTAGAGSGRGLTKKT